MIKSQNTKDEQQKDLCITSEQLTEQWKKGELPEETECYVRVNGDIYLGSIQYKNVCHNKKLPYVKSFNGQFITKYVEEVLTKVPSYDEWQEYKDANDSMFDTIKMLNKDNYKLEKENTKLKIENKWYSEQLNEAVKEVGHLKELLTMVKPVLQLEYNVTENRNLIKKINQALGEE